ncbi:cytochrome P450 [Mycena alexandri]|uniref:Cytochrome P450 n=1 Tax=Mycena alexandri TaxID=1745969 RepID=A0AAD6WTZ8_9AGAR|nr:cytochrome P450 [Mycena alexandri]
MEIHLVWGILPAVALIYWIRGWPTKTRVLPGPRPHPFIGHTLQVPTVKTWKYFEKLYHQYGPIVKLTLAGDDIIVLSHPSDAEELLGRRSHNYSSRPPLIYARKYQSKNQRMVLLPYGEVLKRQRAAFHQMLQPRVVGAYEDMQALESLRLLSDLATTPKDWTHHCQRFAASLVFTLSYGERLNDDGKDLDAVQSILANFVRDTYPGAHLVDTFPILDRLPGFLSPWRAEAQRKHELEVEVSKPLYLRVASPQMKLHVKLYTWLASEVKTRMEKELGTECFAARLWDQQAKMNLTLEELSYIAGSAFEAGTDTTTGTVLWFLMAMAQREIDSIFSSDTVPGFSRMNHMLYCFALVKEVFRWSPAAPGGFPHLSDADDEYQGYAIRKGTMVIPCIWNMHHNEAEFPNSYMFDPERFMNRKSVNDADSLTEGHYGFGFGRRKCPGQYLAAKTIYIAVVRILWGFNIQARKDPSGNEAKVNPENCTSGMTSKPLDFPLDIVPRSAAHIDTIWSGQHDS